MSNLRDFQAQGNAEIKQAWNEGAQVVMPVFPTGAGKTVMTSDLVKTHDAPTAAIAHRQELVSQMALAFNRDGIQHGIIAPDLVIKQIVTMEQELHGRSLYSPRSHVRVAGVDSLPGLDTSDPWLAQVSLVVQDEGHHVLRANKWGRAMDLFTNPNKRGLFPTAHAIRGDGKGLGRNADGLVDRLVIGPSGRDLIDRGFLCDYKLIGIPDDTDLSDVGITDQGEFSPSALRAAIHANKHIVGDVVEHYLHWAPGKLGVTFAVDIEAATDIVRAFRAKNVNAEMITSETPMQIRGQLMRRFRAREIMQLVSVDVLGEGVDVPSIEVVSMARHTMSFQLYAQQFGRGLRTSVSGFIQDIWHTLTDQERKDEIARSGKPKAIIIDHVNNWERHGLPDVPRSYSLDKRPKRKKKAIPDDIPLRHCVNPVCLQPYLAVLVACPNCGARPVPTRRSSPEHVEGNLFELDAEALRAMQMEIGKVDGGVPIVPGISGAAQSAIGHNHHDRQQSQAALRHTMAVWMGWQAHLARPVQEAQKRFYYAFKTDVGSAQALGKADADELHTRIRQDLTRNNVVERTQ